MKKGGERGMQRERGCGDAKREGEFIRKRAKGGFQNRGRERGVWREAEMGMHKVCSSGTFVQAKELFQQGVQRNGRELPQQLS